MHCLDAVLALSTLPGLNVHPAPSCSHLRANWGTVSHPISVRFSTQTIATDHVGSNPGPETQRSETLSKLLNFSVTQFPHLQNGVNNHMPLKDGWRIKETGSSTMHRRMSICYFIMLVIFFLFLIPRQWHRAEGSGV